MPMRLTGPPCPLRPTQPPLALAPTLVPLHQPTPAHHMTPNPMRCPHPRDPDNTDHAWEILHTSDGPLWPVAVYCDGCATRIDLPTFGS